MISNLIFGASLPDIIFRSIATLIGAVIAYLIRKIPYIAAVPTIISNALIIPVVLILQGVGGWNLYFYFAATVGFGELIACGVLGTALVLWFVRHEKQKEKLFM